LSISITISISIATILLIYLYVATTKTLLVILSDISNGVAIIFFICIITMNMQYLSLNLIAQ